MPGIRFSSGIILEQFPSEKKAIRGAFDARGPDMGHKSVWGGVHQITWPWMLVRYSMRLCQKKRVS
jgi:hypothetical protein